MKTIFTLRAGLLLAFILAVSVQGHAQNYSSGNIVVSKVGDGTTAIVSAGVSLPVQLVEFDPYAATPVDLKTVALNNAGVTTKLTLGTLNGEGQLKLSQDGRYITLLGYDSAVNVVAVGGHRLANSTVGRIGFDGTPNLYSFVPTSSAGSVRSAVSIDGSTFFTKSTRPDNAQNVNTSSVATTVATFANINPRTFELFNNILFTATGAHVFAFSSAVTSSTTTGVTSTALPMDNTTNSRGTAANLCGFVFLDSDNDIATGWNGTGLDLLYVADQSSGVFKYYFDGSNFRYRSVHFTNVASTPSNITGRINTAGKAELFYATGNGATANNSLLMLTDNGAKDSPFDAVVKVIATGAGSNYAFRGVAFAPSYTKTWTGTTSTDFNTGSNWADATAPAITDFISIPSGTPFSPVISANTTIAAGTIAAGATLTVNEGIVLNINSSITNNGDLILKSSATGTASLISPSTVANVTQQRYLSSNQRGWRLLSNPVSTKVFNDLATASNITLGTGFTGQYNPGDNTWSSTSGFGNMVTKQAYKVFITGNNGEAPDYTTGPTNVTLVNKGTATNTVPAAIVTTLGEYYLVANPYTAPVSVSSIIATSTGLSNTVSYYNPTIGSTDVKLKLGGYDTPTVSGAAGSATDVVIPPMGAIFVQATSSGTINVPKSAIFTGTPLQVGTYNHKTAQTKVASTNALKIEVSSDGTYYDSVALQFKAVGDAGSNIDFGKLPNSILDAYSLMGSNKMAVSELELAAQIIPLGITSTIQKSYTFKVVENTIPAGFEAVLVDNVLNTSTVLTAGINYNFAIDNNPASQGNARFAINLRTAGALGVIANELDAKIQVYPNPSRGQFNISNMLEGAATIEISSLNGQVIHTQKLNSGTTTIQTKSWATGVYILKATNNGTETTKKLIIQ